MRISFVYDVFAEGQDKKLEKIVKSELKKRFEDNEYFYVATHFAAKEGCCVRIEIDPRSYYADLKNAKANLFIKIGPFQLFKGLNDFLTKVEEQCDFPIQILLDD